MADEEATTTPMEDRRPSPSPGPSPSPDPGPDPSSGPGPSPSPETLVSVTFQKNPARNHKYLEAQPKVLGVCQISLSVYHLTWMCAVLSEELNVHSRTPLLITSTVMMAAGILAITAQKLHLPTLKACLGMQIFAVIASVFNMVHTMTFFESHMVHSCWYDWDGHNETDDMGKLCRQLQFAYSHCYAGELLVQLALVTISATLAVYCCKVVQCCSPASRMPVITVHAPPHPSGLAE